MRRPLHATPRRPETSSVQAPYFDSQDFDPWLSCAEIYFFSVSLVQSEHVLHVVQTARLVGQEARRAQAAVCICDAAGGLVRDLDTFADSGKQHRMIADDIATANGGETDRRRIAFAGHAFARIDRDILQ